MQTIVITGGTGLVGKQLTELLLQKGYRVIILSRNSFTQNQNPNLKFALWNVEKQEIDVEAIKTADAIIHLAGAGVMDKRWTTAYKRQIIDSRVKSGELLVKVIKENETNIKTFISASAIGFYGKDVKSNYFFKEDDLTDNSFLGKTCALWEQSVEPVNELNIRLVKYRIGIVLSKNGGAFTEFKKSLRFKIAAILGSGKQMASWIHIDDLCNLLLLSLENNNINGVYNAVADEPVSNKILMLHLAKKMCGKFYLPIKVPAFLLKLILGEGSVEILKSTTVSNKKIKDAGYNFLFNNIDDAIDDLL